MYVLLLFCGSFLEYYWLLFRVIVTLLYDFWTNRETTSRSRRVGERLFSHNNSAALRTAMLIEVVRWTFSGDAWKRDLVEPRFRRVLFWFCGCSPLYVFYECVRLRLAGVQAETVGWARVFSIALAAAANPRLVMTHPRKSRLLAVFPTWKGFEEVETDVFFQWWIHDLQRAKPSLRLWDSGSTPNLILSKSRWAKIAADLAIPHPKTFRYDGPVESPPCSGDLFVKPDTGLQGLGSQVLLVLADGVYKDAASHEIRKLKEHLAKRKQPFVIQPVLRNHPTIVQLVDNISCLCTIRIVTGNMGEDLSVVSAVLKIPLDRNVIVDNTHATLSSGNAVLHANINLERGFIDRVVNVPGLDMVASHPVSRFKMIGMQIPFFVEALEYCLRAHLEVENRTNMKIPWLGFDMALTEDGPVLLEGNLFAGLCIYGLASLVGESSLKLTLEHFGRRGSVEKPLFK